VPFDVAEALFGLLLCFFGVPIGTTPALSAL
jgi:hypothetical protein